MSRVLAVVVFGALVVPQAVFAEVNCADRTPSAITLAAADSRKCQDTIAKAGAKFLKAQMKTLSKCQLKQPAGSCPTTDDTDKINKAADKAASSINKVCGTDSVQAGLSSSYAAGTDDAVISSCMLSQHSVTGRLVVAESHGATTEAWVNTGKERADCVKEVAKQGVKFFTAALKVTQKCLKSQSKLGTAGNLSPICLGSFSGGDFVPPTDLKATDGLAKEVAKAESALTKKCAGAAGLQQIATLFACNGPGSIGQLEDCILCNGMNGTFNALEQQFSETGTFVANGAGAIQAAVTAASAGDKLLIGSGTYQEEVEIAVGQDNLQVVGCGAAKNDRPRIIPPVTQVTGNGIDAANVDGLLFQSLDFFDQDSNHIFVAQAQGVTFRDITGDGDRNTAYAVFPVRSNNVLVELCRVEAQNDAPIYVGQSSGIVVRYNDVRDGVAGMEIENSGSAQVYGNYATGNTAGLMVFKDNDLPIQLSECHQVHHNLFENNNEPNFGSGSVAGVPAGTGTIVISADTTPYSYNIMRGNNTTGITFTTQDIAGFNPPSEQSVDSNYFFNNWLTGNGTSPDPDNWPLPFGADVVFLTSESSDNCESGNVFNTEIGFASFASNTPPNDNSGTCVLPVPDFPGCPAPSVPDSPSMAFID